MIEKIVTAIVFLIFTLNVQAQNIGIIGDYNNWTGDVTMTTTDHVNYYLSSFTFTFDGGLKFRQDASWTNSWSSNSFPNGTGTQTGGAINVIAGNYNIAFNRLTGVYSFTVAPTGFDNIGFIGGFNNWTESVPMIATNGINFTKSDYYFSANGVKFRKDNNWNVAWGSDAFPHGITSLTGGNIPLVAGFYNVFFNKNTLEFWFDLVPVSIIGSSAMGWNTDVALNTSDNGITYSLDNFVLQTGELKFRANTNWAKSWGSVDFPSGIGIIGGANIPITAGTYNITFNRITGEYNFQNALSTESFKTQKVAVYPNPTISNWNFKANILIENIQIIDVIGKIIFSEDYNSNQTTVDATSFSSGVYFARIKSNQEVDIIKLIKN